MFPCAARNETTEAAQQGMSPNVADSDIKCHDFKRSTIDGTRRSARWCRTELLRDASNVYRHKLLVRTSTVLVYAPAIVSGASPENPTAPHGSTSDEHFIHPCSTCTLTAISVIAHLLQRLGRSHRRWCRRPLSGKGGQRITLFHPL